MPSSPKILQLRELLAARGLGTVARAPEGFHTGWAALDAAAGEGLPKGDIAELNCLHGGGALAVAECIHAAERGRYYVALIDGADGFDPASVETSALTRLLWVRCHSAAEAVKAADLLLRDGNLPLVLLNLRGCADAARVPSQAWYRLQRIVEQSGVALLVLTPRPLIPSARIRLILHGHFTIDDVERSCADLVEGVTFEALRGSSARRLVDDAPQLAEVG
ncbi:MAG: hypothetical protein JWQ44_2142 [Chthoniobacter sp.]|nr:hypothetical protein [Chthoniobacter sp.]